MKVQLEGATGSWGTLFKNISTSEFEIVEDADTVIFAVGIKSFEEIARRNRGKHFVNPCSVQIPSTQVLQVFSDRVTSIHPMFGARTPENLRFWVITSLCGCPEEKIFLEKFAKITGHQGKMQDIVQHDEWMKRVHFDPMQLAEQIKKIVDAAKDIPDEFIPNSFRLFRQLSKTYEDMPAGTMESIRANPFALDAARKS